MKFLVFIAVAVACASADVSHIVKDESTAQVVKSDYELSPEGAFQFAYETANGIYAQASGAVKNQNSEYPSLEVNGAYKYTSPEGTPIEITYKADEAGYQPSGSHLPVPPPIPDYIYRSLQYIAEHPPPAEIVKTVAKPAYG